MKGSKRIFTVVAMLLVGLLVFTGCGTKNNGSNSNSNVSGTLTIAGSTALQPLVEQAANQFMSKNPNAQITVQGGGSGRGLSMVAEGSINIGNSDIFAEEKLDATAAKQLVDHKVAVVGFATIVNPKITIDNLTKQQLIDIFTGKIKNWKDVGGPDQKIVVINRPTSSGTRVTFKKYALDGKEEAQGLALTEDSSGAVKKTVADTPGAISYVAISYVDDSVKALKLDGVEPTVENITSGKYPIWSYEHMYTKGEPTGLAKAFLDYMMSSEVVPLIKQMGYIPISDMKVSRDK
ncbi:phosphate ABC transporter substrate-binding protein, PhoT family [Caldanaerobius fijiensis DSM 17918]|uniref:Phosphate-binding protein n=1 Tax=Caldanaerobius fijiensis DSM 17918 TaxID=1121256 RepID=A0A1M5FED6_9THEO|nr:phosphate ABC transporter substrate-binding protein [Caldanaerobius fijiensis]SHF89461.1 phosphate ABC transporter substrate-binding protein, PhoT family [Caldanaerobius fijiensis DSM 17918]